MKTWLAGAVVVSFVAIAVFGFFAMGNFRHGAHAHDGCIGALANGAACPGTDHPLDFLAFHLGAFAKVSTGLAGTATLILLLLTLSAVSAFHIRQSIATSLVPARHFTYRVREPDRRLISTTDFRAWLALREARDLR